MRQTPPETVTCCQAWRPLFPARGARRVPPCYRGRPSRHGLPDVPTSRSENFGNGAASIGKRRERGEFRRCFLGPSSAGRGSPWCANRFRPGRRALRNRTQSLPVRTSRHRANARVLGRQNAVPATAAGLAGCPGRSFVPRFGWRPRRDRSMHAVASYLGVNKTRQAAPRQSGSPLASLTPRPLRANPKVG